ncbi:MAG: GWxTD domain-containing protein [Candidatus Latescibacteria bacterium]|nr:GWxTD domain-containing protein [Candidatus Latescibacterota bacterium]
MQGAGPAGVVRRILSVSMAAAAVLITFVSPSQAQDLQAPTPLGPEFHASVVTFQSDRGVDQTLVEVYVSIAHDQLAFTRAGEIFRANYNLNLHLSGPRGETVFDETTGGVSVTPLYEETLSEDISKVQRFTFVVRPGEYELSLKLTDLVLNESREEKMDVHVPRYMESRLGISGLLLADFLGESSPGLPVGAVVDRAGTQVFTRQGHSYIPNTLGIYTNFTSSLLGYYEIYGLNPIRQMEHDSFYKVEFYVNNASGETVLYYMRQHEKPGSVSYNSVEMNIQDLRPGGYTLQVTASDMGTGTSVTSGREFTVLESYLSLAYYDYDKAVRQLRYIATERELRILRNAKEGERLRLFRSFWASRDPTPSTKRNEALIEYYRRIAYANEAFRVPQLEGWATDRGMVYITLGLPDYIERESFAAGSKPLEAWVYNSMRLSLLFVDEAGFGDFILQNRQEYMERVQWRRPQ